MFRLWLGNELGGDQYMYFNTLIILTVAAAATFSTHHTETLYLCDTVVLILSCML